MNREIAYKPGKKRSDVWNKVYPSGAGLAFAISFDDLERILKHVRRLKDNENIERVEIGPEGITVFVGKENEKLL